MTQEALVGLSNGGTRPITHVVPKKRNARGTKRGTKQQLFNTHGNVDHRSINKQKKRIGTWETTLNSGLYQYNDCIHYTMNIFGTALRTNLAGAFDVTMYMPPVLSFKYRLSQRLLHFDRFDRTLLELSRSA